MKKITIKTHDDAEVQFPADAFEHFAVETKKGLVTVVVGVKGPEAEALVAKMVACVRETSV